MKSFPLLLLALFGSVLAPLSPASAELVISQLVVELKPGTKVREDIEIVNEGPERTYVAVEPSEIVRAGLPSEERWQEPDPEKLGLLVSPSRAILEPGQRKLVRVAAIGIVPERERVYRVTVRPVVGDVAANQSGLKLLIGYDLLVLVRPAEARSNIVGTRSGSTLTLRNDGNSSVELVDGKHCNISSQCRQLSGKRLYAGAEWRQELPVGGSIEYTVRSISGSVRKSF